MTDIDALIQRHVDRRTVLGAAVCYIRGPESILVGLAAELATATPP